MLKLKGKLVFTVVLLWGMVCEIFAYPDGAPERACYRMIPRHTHPFSGRAIRAQPSNIKPPYNITLSRTLWNPDVPITVTIHGGAPFKGFMLMAAEDSLMDMPTGKFFANGATDVKTMFCSFPSDAATHTDSKWKSHITVDWYAPAFTSADHMQFIATVVTNRSTVWTNIKSAFLQADPAVSERPEFGEAAEGGMMPGMGGAGGGGLDQWGYPISTTPGYGGWGGGFGGGFGAGVTQEYTTVSPDTPVRSEAGSSRSRTGRRQSGRSRLSTGDTTTQTPTQGERWGEGRSRNSGWGERAGGRGGEGSSRASGRAGSEGTSRVGTGGGARGETRGGARGGSGGGWGEGRRGGAGRAGGRRGGRGGGGGGDVGRGGGWGAEGGFGNGGGSGGFGGGFAGGFGGGEGAMQRRFQQMFMQWLMGGGQNGGSTGGGGGGAGTTGGMNGFSNMFWRK